jgi:hypothetical protein
VELHVTPDQIELRPTRANLFGPVTIARGDLPTITTVWSPFGRGIRFSGATLGRRTTFWPARHGSVIEAMQQLAWPIDEEREAPGPLPAPAPHPLVRSLHPISYRCSWVVLLLAPLIVAMGWLLLQVGLHPVVPIATFAFWTWAIGTTVYGVECDGVTFTCSAPLWRRRLSVHDVLTVQGARRGLIASGGKTTITPRTGPRSWLLVPTRRDRARFDQFLDQLGQVAPTIAIRR